MKARIFILLLLLSGVAQAITPWEKYSITQAIGQGAWETSELLFRKLKESQLPAEQAAQVDYNLGLSLYHQEKYGDALPLFESAAKSNDEALKAKALYNQGNSLFKMEKLDEAKAAYEKALLTNPDDDDTRHNIEVILKKQQQQQNQDNQDKQDQDKSEQQNDQQDQNSDKEDKGDSKEKEQNKDQQNKDQKNQDSEGEQNQQEQSGKEDKAEDGKPQEMTEAEKKAAQEKAEQARLLDYFKQQERDGRPATRVRAQTPPGNGKSW
jgi:tetratricopeptide (TPR) repeat protein